MQKQTQKLNCAANERKRPSFVKKERRVAVVQGVVVISSWLRLAPAWFSLLFVLLLLVFVTSL